jgi:O-antigen ligase
MNSGEDARPSFRRHAAITGFYALLPAIAVAGGLALAPLQAAAALVGVRARLHAPHVATWVLLAFGAWALISSAWSPADGVWQGLRLLAGLLSGLLFLQLSQSQARHARAGAAASVLVLLALSLFEAASHVTLNQLGQPDNEPWNLESNAGRGVSVLVCMAWGAAAALWRLRAPWKFAAPLVVVLAGVCALQFRMSANFAAFAAGLLALALALFAARTTFVTVASSVGLWLLAAPWLMPAVSRLAPDMLPLSWRHRLEIWAYVSRETARHPVFGSGLDASRVHPDTLEISGVMLSRIPLHPHSASLQIWFETGAVGALLASATLALIARAALRSPGFPLAAASATLASFAALANLSYGVWQEWWIAAAFSAAAAVIVLARDQEAS